MLGMRACHVNRVQGWVGYQLLIAAVGPADAILGAKASAFESVREPTAPTTQSGTKKDASAKAWAMVPQAKIPHRMGFIHIPSFFCAKRMTASKIGMESCRMLDTGMRVVFVLVYHTSLLEE